MITPEQRAEWREHLLSGGLLSRDAQGALLNALDAAERERDDYRRAYEDTTKAMRQRASTRKVGPAWKARAEQAERERAEALAKVARVRALADEWATTLYDSATTYREGKSDQLDRCEQRLRAALDGDQR